MHIPHLDGLRWLPRILCESVAALAHRAGDAPSVQLRARRAMRRAGVLNP
eukprot:SAG31_NODE_272_length_18690_cov_14.520785_20_plen_50_part_00